MTEAAMEGAMVKLLDPKNDYVFKRLFAGDPELTVALINDLRPDAPPVVSVTILNPSINASELSGKGIVLDVRARCVDGHQYNTEMRDATQPHVMLGSELQLTVMELKKADRLGQLQGAPGDWVRFFEHWQEDTVMANVTHEPVRKAMGSIKELSADEEAQRLAEARERGLINWHWSLNAARQEGLEQGLEQGQRRTLQRQLTQRFGELPTWALGKLKNASAETLDAWADNILTADSLAELLGEPE